MHARNSVRPIAAVLAVLLIGVSGGYPAADGATIYDIKRESFVVATKYGDIHVEVARPVKPNDPTKVVRGPAILTYTPYSVLYTGGRTASAKDWVPQGYVRVVADLVGTGNSGGCWDYGGIREKTTGYLLVEWIAKQRWSTGKVAMMGVSYEGTTAWATAVTRPPHLTTIIPEAGIARWYDYAYSGGIRYLYDNEATREGPGVPSNGFVTPLVFDFGLAIPPPSDVSDPKWGRKVQQRVRPCEQLEHTQQGYSQTPDYGKFWVERDYLRDANRIRIPVLIAANWGDWNVKQEESILMYRAIRHAPKKALFMGNAWRGHGVPGGDYRRTVHAWLDHYLLGSRNGVQRMPTVISQTADLDGHFRWTRGQWPRVTNVVLYPQETPVTSPDDYAWKMLPTRPMKSTPGMPMPRDPAKFPSVGINTESHSAHHARANHDWFWFEAPRFKKDVRLFGSPRLQVYLETAREWVTVTPSLFDLDMAKMKMVAGQHVARDPTVLTAVTRGWLDSRYRNGLGKQVVLKVGRPFGLDVTMKPTDWTFRKGHQLGLAIATEINEWSVPKPYSCRSTDCVDMNILWAQAKTRLVVPVVGRVTNPKSLFDLSGHPHI